MHRKPPLSAVEGPGLDLLDQAADVAQLGFPQGSTELRFHPEQPRHLLLLSKFTRSMSLSELGFEQLSPFPQQRRHVARGQGRQEGQGSLEARIVLDRRGDQLGEPVVRLDEARIGEPVDSALRQPPCPFCLLRFDQTTLPQRRHHRIQRPIVEPHALVLVALAQCGRHLIGVHRLLSEADQHGQRQRVAPAVGRHPNPFSTTLGRVSVDGMRATLRSPRRRHAAANSGLPAWPANDLGVRPRPAPLPGRRARRGEPERLADRCHRRPSGHGASGHDPGPDLCRRVLQVHAHVGGGHAERGLHQGSQGQRTTRALGALAAPGAQCLPADGDADRPEHS
jgi:hypothetical protein